MELIALRYNLGSRLENEVNAEPFIVYIEEHKGRDGTFTSTDQRTEI
jgi:hypothetical protein